jgi:hypothetical protein
MNATAPPCGWKSQYYVTSASPSRPYVQQTSSNIAQALPCDSMLVMLIVISHRNELCSLQDRGAALMTLVEFVVSSQAWTRVTGFLGYDLRWAGFAPVSENVPRSWVLWIPSQLWRREKSASAEGLCWGANRLLFFIDLRRGEHSGSAPYAGAECVTPCRRPNRRLYKDSGFCVSRLLSDRLVTPFPELHTRRPRRLRGILCLSCRFEQCNFETLQRQLKQVTAGSLCDVSLAW